MTDQKFGFTVAYTDGNPEYNEKPGWSVYLPHQCDDWDIDPGWYGSPSTQEDALAALDAFIAEAQQAREALARGEQFGGEQ